MQNRRVRGLSMVLAAGLLYSTAGLFTRAIHLDVMTILGWRGVFGTLFMLGWMAVETRGAPWRTLLLSPGDAVLAVLTGFGGFFYIEALRLTTVADVMVVYATMPFVTMAVAWVWTRETPSRRMLVAAAVALAGVAIMVTAGGGGEARLAGIGLTLLMNLAFATILVSSRARPDSATAIFTVGTILGSVAAFVLSPNPAVGPTDLALLALFGLATIGLAMALYIAGARLIPPAEAGLVGIVDVVIGPALVWFVFGEKPGVATLVGGAVVLLALAWHLLPDIRRLIDGRSAPVLPAAPRC